MSNITIYNAKREEANKKVEQLINSGEYPVVDLEIFERFKNYIPSERVIFQADYTIDLYKELYDELMSMTEETRNVFLSTLKEADIIDNQSIEKEDSFFISLYRNMSRQREKTAVENLINNYGNDIDAPFFIENHDLLLSGSSSSMLKGVRDDNLQYVGRIKKDKLGNSKRVIEYFPIRYTEVEEAIEMFVNYYNASIKNPINLYDALIKSIIYHGLIATLQIFKDGNTRYGRLYQNVSLWGALNKELPEALPLPIVYASRQYAGCSRDEYRGLITDIVTNKKDAIDKWVEFNFKKLQDGLNYNTYYLKRVSQQLESSNYPFRRILK